MKINGPSVENSNRKWFLKIAFFLVLFTAFFVRFYDLDYWLENKEFYFFDHQQLPILISIDAYYYLDIAKELLEGKYQHLDLNRHVPHGHINSFIPPLLSLILSYLAKLFSAPLEWVAILLPAFLGSLIAIPAYLLGYAFGQRMKSPFIREENRETAATVMGLTTALFTSLSPMLVSRSSVGWCDTDSLNVFFPVLASVLALHYADAKNSRERHYYFFGWCATFFMFLWWWDQSYIAVLVLAGLPLFIAAILVSRKSFNDLIPVFIVITLFVITLIIWKGFGIFKVTYDNLLGISTYITSDDRDTSFAAADLFVTEQFSPSLTVIANSSAGNLLQFYIAVTGLLGLIIMARHYVLYMLAILIAGGLSLVGVRFVIFLAPLIGLGLGTIAFLIWNHLNQAPWNIATLTTFMLGLSWVPFDNDLKGALPNYRPDFFESLLVLEDRLPQNAVIWTSWGYGHPLIYYTNKGTIGDGMYHSAILQYVIYFPMAIKNYRLAANWMQFYVNHGMAGLRKVNKMFGHGPDDWEKGLTILQKLLAQGIVSSRKTLNEVYGYTGEDLGKTLAFLFPNEERPVYLYLDYKLLMEGWSLYGCWDFNTKSCPDHNDYLLIDSIWSPKDGLMEGESETGSHVRIDTKHGIVYHGADAKEISKLNINKGKQTYTTNYDSESNLILDIITTAQSGIGVLGNTDTTDSILMKLFFEPPYNNDYFSLIHAKPGFYSIWKVKADNYKSSAELVSKNSMKSAYGRSYQAAKQLGSVNTIECCPR